MPNLSASNGPLSASNGPQAASTTPASGPPDPQARGDRLLLWIAAERTVRAVVLFAVGIALIANPHHDWGKTVANVARHLGLNPNSDGIEKIIHKLHAIGSDRLAVYGIIALAYGALEAAEGYGLWTRRRWAEYLTVLATSLLFVPEIWEIVNKATVLKAGALTVNVAVVLYLIYRLRKDRRPESARTA